MANEILQFKMGDWTAGFDNIAKKPGTIYITKNEKAMYVDIDADTRIRINDIIQVDSAKTVTPPFNQNAFYYFITENALMRYDGTKWVQLNSTADIQNKVNEIEASLTNLGKVVNGDSSATDQAVKDGLAGRLAKAETAIAENTENIATNTATIGTHTTDITALKDKVGTAGTEGGATATGLYKEIEDVEALVSDNASDITALGQRVANNETGLKTATDNITGLTDKLGTATDDITDTTAFGKINNLNGRLKTVETDLGTAKTDINNLKSEVSTNADGITENAKAIEALQSAVGDGAEGLATKVSTLESEMDTAQKDIGDLKTADETLTEAVENAQSTADNVRTDLNALSNTVTALNGTVSTNTNNISANATAINGVKGRMDTAESDIDAVENRATALENLVGKSASEGLRKDVADNTEAIEENSLAISTLNADSNTEGSVDYKVAQAKTALETQIDNEVKAVNAMTFKGGIEANGELPTTGVKIGDTYVFNVSKVVGSETYYAGDFAIASGTEGSDGFITAETLSWNHVETGYIKEHEPELAGEDNKITLTSYASTGGEVGDLGAITFEKVEDTAITVSVTDSVVSIGLQWGSF